MLGSLWQPILFLVSLGFGIWPMYQQASGGNYIDFLAPGIICMTILFTAMFNGIEVIRDRQFWFLKETLVAPVSRYNIMLWRTLGWATVASIQWVFVFFISMIIGFRPEQRSTVFVAFAFMFLIALLFTALGTAIASMLEDMQGFQLIMNFVIMPIFFLSGVLFPLDWLPKAMSYITKFNPLTYWIDAVRWALINVSHFSMATNFIVLSIITLFILLIWSYLFSKVEI